MKAAAYDATGGPEVLCYQEVADPVCGPVRRSDATASPDDRLAPSGSMPEGRGPGDPDSVTEAG